MGREKEKDGDFAETRPKSSSLLALPAFQGSLARAPAGPVLAFLIKPLFTRAASGTERQSDMLADKGEATIGREKKGRVLTGREQEAGEQEMASVEGRGKGKGERGSSARGQRRQTGCIRDDQSAAELCPRARISVSCRLRYSVPPPCSAVGFISSLLVLVNLFYQLFSTSGSRRFCCCQPLCSSLVGARTNHSPHGPALAILSSPEHYLKQLF